MEEGQNLFLTPIKRITLAEIRVVLENKSTKAWNYETPD
jgi:hypothetical protein